MANIHRLEIVIDRDADLAPQVIVYRFMGVPWALIEPLAGKRKNRLEEAIARWRARQSDGKKNPGLTL